MDKFTVNFIVFIVLSLAHGYSQSTATYDITFTSIWNSTDHTSLPGNAHWSKLVGACHKTPGVFLKVGELASAGIKNIAEIGNNTVFNEEVNNQINAGEANQYINGPSLGSATGDVLISNLQVDENYPLISLVSMIAPSPDWMIAIDGFSLLDNGAWKTSVSLDVYAYDAGTDDGTDYTSADAVSNPFQPISLMNGSPFWGNKIGTLSMVLTNVTKLDKLNVINSVKIYPNPVNAGGFIIQNSESVDIRRVELYNSVGAMVKHNNYDLYAEKFYVDVAGILSGIYFLKIITATNRVITRKLVIQ